MKESIIKLGLVGLGRVAEHHLPVLEMCTEQYLLAAVCDKDPMRLSRMETVQTFSDLSRMLDSCQLDALLVAVPNKDHFEVAHTALSHKVSVLIEKPATETIGQFRELMSLAEKQGVLLHSALHAAFARDLMWFIAEQRRLGEALGPLTALKCGFYDPFVRDGRLHPAATSRGGSWADSGVNALSVVLKILPDIRIEEARMTKVSGRLAGEVQGSADFTFDVDGCACGVGSIDTNWTLGLDRKVTSLFYGQTGSRIILDHSNQVVRQLGPDGKNEVLADLNSLERHRAQYIGVYEDFFGHFQKAEDNREMSLRILEKLYSIQ